MPKQRVVIVESERGAGEGMAQTLAGAGYEVTGVVRSVQEAARHLEQNGRDGTVIRLIGADKLDQIARAETAEQRLQVALRAARMGTWDWEIQTNKETFDDNLRKLFGLRPEEEIRTIDDFYARIHPEDRARVMAAFEKTRMEGEHLDTEFRVKRADGTERWLMDQGEVILGEDGRPERLTGACVDITERKQAQEMLRESEERLRLFQNSVREYALFQMNERGEIVSWNEGAERVLGYTGPDILGKPGEVLFVPEDVAKGDAQREFEEAARSGQSQDERWHLRKDGTRFWCNGVLARINDAQGRLRGFAKVMKDETERMRAREELTNSLAEKEALLKEIHHRVKNNLQVITSLLTLQSDAVKDEKTRMIFDEAVNRVRAIGDIHELLYRSPDLARVDFRLYIGRLAQSLFESYGVDEKRIRFRVDAANVNLDIAKAIPCGLIVNELLTNALKHAFPNGRSGEIRMGLKCEEGQCWLEIADDGIGLPRGFSVDDTASLGLKIVAVLAKQLGSELHFDGRKGTRVEITFPISETGHSRHGKVQQ